MIKAKWYPLIIICLVQVLSVSDNSVMYNSLSSLVIGFHTHVAAIQLTNMIYPLIGGSLMLSSALLGIEIGWKKLLCSGILILAIGETAAVFSMNVMFFTWVARVIAGTGSSLAMAAAIGLVPETYQGKDVAIGFGAIGAAIGVASIIGPIGGGWIIDHFGWRPAFCILAIMDVIVFFTAFGVPKRMTSNVKAKFDFLGSLLFIPSMILITISLIKVGSWNATKLLSVVSVGIILLALFLIYEFNLEKKRKLVLFPMEFLKSKQVRDGLAMISLIFFMAGGASFALITYLQVVLGYSALITGFVLATNALGMIVFSIGTPLLIKNVNPRLICQMGILLACLAGLVIAFGIDPAALNVIFFIGIFLIGSAIGLLSSQAGVIVTSNIEKAYAAQSGGIQGSIRNLAQAVGIALIGLIMITALTASVKNHVLKAADIQINIKNEIRIREAVPFVSNKQLTDYLNKMHLSQETKNEIIHINGIGRLHSLRLTFISFTIFAFLFIFFTFNIPTSFAQEALKKEGERHEGSIK